MTSSTPVGVSRGLEDLVAQLRRDGGQGRGPSPVEKWNPTYCGEAGLEIRRDGSWWHEGARMTREPLVRLFATVLRKDDDGKTYLVTPGEKIIIDVEDAPFLGIRADRVGEGENQTIVFTTNVGDVVTLDAAHPLRVTIDPETREPRPYVLVRGRLEARILRAPFYEIVEWAEPRDGMLGVWSGGDWFAIDAAQ